MSETKSVLIGITLIILLVVVYLYSNIDEHGYRGIGATTSEITK